MTLVSVVTPTWLRHDHLILRCIPSVEAQTWPDVEHIVVSDGPDPALRELLQGQPVTYLEVPEHHTYPGGLIDYGSRPRNHAARQARGKFVAYLDDDNAYRPKHLELLVQALDGEPDADFAYSVMHTHPQDRLVGGPVPAYGAIDTSMLMHRAGLLERCGWWPLPTELPLDAHAPDWGVVERWLNAGAQWTRVVAITVDYYFAGS